MRRLCTFTAMLTCFLIALLITARNVGQSVAYPFNFTNRRPLPTEPPFDALLPARCGQYRTGFDIRFFPTGMSCGGVITLSRFGSGYEVRVNWLTGGVEIVPINPT